MSGSKGEEIKYSWTLSSSRGWEEISFSVRDIVTIRDENYLVTQVSLNGLFYNRIIEDGELQKEFVIELPQMLVDEWLLREYYRKLSNWLKTPINQLSSSRPDDSGELCGIEGQSLIMKYDTRQDVICEIGHYTCTVNYKTNFIIGECVFVTDPTCLQMMVGQMKRLFTDNT